MVEAAFRIFGHQIPHVMPIMVFDENIKGITTRWCFGGASSLASLHFAGCLCSQSRAPLGWGDYVIVSGPPLHACIRLRPRAAVNLSATTRLQPRDPPYIPRDVAPRPPPTLALHIVPRYSTYYTRIPRHPEPTDSPLKTTALGRVVPSGRVVFYKVLYRRCAWSAQQWRAATRRH